jgi:hypothetical protein
VIFTATVEGGKIMDPLTLIISALTAGVAAATQTVVGDAIKEAYVGLKGLLQQKFAGKQSAEIALDEHETDPTTWETPLKKALTQAQADQDEAIIKAAQRVMSLVPQQAAIGNVQITGNVGTFIYGEKNKTTQNFS